MKPTSTRKSGRVSDRKRLETGRGASSMRTGRSIMSSGRSLASNASVKQTIAKRRHARRMKELQAKFEAAATKREQAEQQVRQLEAQVDKICDQFGRIQVANPSKTLEELEPMHRWELHLTKQCNHVVALEAERRRQLARARADKAQFVASQKKR